MQLFRACSGIAFGAKEAKFNTKLGEMREHSLRYVTEEQQSLVLNRAIAARRVIPEQALQDYKINLCAPGSQLTLGHQAGEQ